MMTSMLLALGTEWGFQALGSLQLPNPSKVAVMLAAAAELAVTSEASAAIKCLARRAALACRARLHFSRFRI